MNNFALIVLVLWSMYATFRWYCNCNDRDFFKRQYKTAERQLHLENTSKRMYKHIAERAYKELDSALNRLSRKRKKTLTNNETNQVI